MPNAPAGCYRADVVRFALFLVLMLSSGMASAQTQPRLAPSGEARAALARGDTAAAWELLWREAADCQRRHPRDAICLDLLFASAETALALGHKGAESGGFQALLLTKTPQERSRALYLMLAGRNLGGYFAGLDDPFAKEALETIRSDPALDPVLVAKMRSVLAVALDGLGRHAEAERMHREALEGLRPQRAKLPLEYTAALGALARSLDKLGRNIEAEPLWRDALAIRQAQRGVPATDFYQGLGANLAARNRCGEAEPLLRLAIAEYRTRVAVPGARLNLAWSLSDLGACLDMLGRAAEASPLYQEASNLSKVGASLPSQFTGQNWLRRARNAYTLRQLGDALFMVDAAIIMLKTEQVPDHPDVARALHLRGFILETSQNLKEAGAMYREAQVMWSRTLQPGHPDRVIGDTTLALYLTRRGGDDREARALLLQARNGVLERMRSMPAFDAEAQGAIRLYSPLFRGQVQTAWRLARAEGQAVTGTP